MSLINRLFAAAMTWGGDKKPSLDGLLAQFDRELSHFPQLVEPAKESPPRTPFDSVNLPFEQMSMARMTPRQILRLLPVMVPLMLQMRRSAKFYADSTQPTKIEADPTFLHQLELMAYASGVSQVQYIRVPHNAIFQQKGIPYEYAILYTVEMNREVMSTAPSFDAFEEVANGYKSLAVIGNKLTRFIRRQGFAAYPGTALGGLTDYPHLAELAGLGAIGYHGLLITPKEGARLRINTIYTNITNLPITARNDHLWIRDFCASCKKCIRQCPVNAIYLQPRPRGDGGMRCIDQGKCCDYFNSNFGCAICLAVCPFSQAGYEKVHARFKGNANAPSSAFQLPLLAVVPEIKKVVI